MSLERPLLTFDMDGVLCRPPFGINPGSGRHKRRDAPGQKGLLWATESWRYHFRKPMPGAVEGYKELAQAFACAVVTARGEPAGGLTRAWFERYFGFVPELHMRPGWGETSAQFKARKMAELKPVAHFEDDPFTAQWVAELTGTVFLIDWKRNRGLSGDGIQRVRTIADAVPLLERAAHP
ncbi:MAG: hypothetical protein IPH65_05775 [Dehalococcoidia bacterium]|uniref:hypothetical protein n=1 Tax=Candidatus Amarobacter glycogenicus TaxID=3140699 RepID=UPI0031364C7D|nr:hypothetical protein [Dehalococcoidia bacterium]